LAKLLNIKFNENLVSVLELPHEDRQTDMAKLIDAFFVTFSCEYANKSKL
jgi:hypothetical protein